MQSDDKIVDLIHSTLIILVVLIIIITCNQPLGEYEPVEESVDITEAIETYWEPFETETESEQIRIETETETETETEYTEEDFYDDLELLAYCTMAEAGNQEELGQRLVIDCILNRVDSPYFPDSVNAVIFQKNPVQFAVTVDGNLYRHEPTEDIYRLIREEIADRTNTEVIYFNSIGFTKAGEQYAKVGAHYFSKLRKELQ